MSITTYAELKSAIADFLNREDLTSVIPTFIALAEASLNRDLRHWQMEKRSTATFDGQYEALPSDWVETVRVKAGNYSLDLMSQADMLDKREAYEDATGAPQFYAHTAGQLELYPTPDGSYSGELVYYAKIPALSDSNTSNWLLSLAPDAYLYGSLLHTAPYLKNDERVATWATLYSNAVKALNATSRAGKWGGSGLTRR